MIIFLLLILSSIHLAVLLLLFLIVDVLDDLLLILLLFTIIDLAQVLVDVLVLIHQPLDAVDPIVVHEDAVEGGPGVLSVLGLLGGGKV